MLNATVTLGIYAGKKSASGVSPDKRGRFVRANESVRMNSVAAAIVIIDRLNDYHLVSNCIDATDRCITRNLFNGRDVSWRERLNVCVRARKNGLADPIGIPSAVRSIIVPCVSSGKLSRGICDIPAMRENLDPEFSTRSVTDPNADKISNLSLKSSLESYTDRTRYHDIR